MVDCADTLSSLMLIAVVPATETLCGEWDARGFG